MCVLFMLILFLLRRHTSTTYTYIVHRTSYTRTCKKLVCESVLISVAHMKTTAQLPHDFAKQFQICFAIYTHEKTTTTMSSICLSDVMLRLGLRFAPFSSFLVRSILFFSVQFQFVAHA